MGQHVVNPRNTNFVVPAGVDKIYMKPFSPTGAANPKGVVKVVTRAGATKNVTLDHVVAMSKGKPFDDIVSVTHVSGAPIEINY